MKFNSVWLSVLTMLRRGAPAAAAALLLLAGSGSAQATTFNFNGNGVVPICPLTGTTYNCTSLPNNADTDVIVIASGYTVNVSSSVAFSYNQGLQMSGSAKLQSSGGLNIADVNPSNLNVSGGTLAAGGNFKIGNQAQSIVANVSAASMTIGSGSATKIVGTLTATGQIDLGSNATIVGAVSGAVVTSNSPVTINGNVNAGTSFQLASGSKLNGNLTSPKVTLDPSSVTVNGSIAATTSLTIGSGNTVNGTVSGGSLSMASSNVTINGNVTMTGDVSIGSSGTINGDLVAHNVTTQSSGDYISGNASVNAIYLDYGARVGKTITCTGAPPGAAPCSCVTRADSNYQPSCGAPAASGAHHIQITHSGQGLTCQAQTVTLKACADSTCSATYNGSTTVTLLPGGGPAFSFNGSTSASVRYPSATDSNGTPLSAAVNGISNANVCPNASSGTDKCSMVFKDTGLQISVPDHIAMTTPPLSVQALQSDPNIPGSCVPLVKDLTVPVNFTCKYMNPSSGAASSPVIINYNGADYNVACGGGGTTIQLAFDGSGIVKPALSLRYAEVGQVSLSAAYTGSGGNANLAASGSDDFIAAPAGFKIEATRVTTGGSFAAGVFGNPGDVFTLKVSAVNAATPTPGVTTNFGKESSAEYFRIDPVLKFPSGGLMPTTSVNGQFGAISDGVGVSKNGSVGQWHFDEVGTLTLNATLANQSTYYMGISTPNTFATKGTLDLRFVPHHFNTTLVAGAPMDCSKLGGTNPCATLNTVGKFIYSKQVFDMRVTAYNDAASASVSQNYVDKLKDDAEGVARPVTISLWQAAGGSTSADFPAGGFTQNVAFSFSKGVGTVAAGGPLPAISFKYALPDAKTDPTTVFIRAEADSVTSKRSNAVEAPLTVVSGQMQVSNNYGSANSPMPVEVQAQYYSAAVGAYVFNSQFSPVSPAAGANVSLANNIVYQNCTKQLACGSLQAMAPGTLNFQNGKATFRLASPSADGTVDVMVVPATPSPWTNSLPSTIPYLPAPIPGRATFGIYRSGPVIYTREVHN